MAILSDSGKFFHVKRGRFFLGTLSDWLPATSTRIDSCPLTSSAAFFWGGGGLVAFLI